MGVGDSRPWILLLAGWGAIACAHPTAPSRTPGPALDRLAAALRRGDGRTVHALFREDLRRSTSAQTVQASLRAHPQEARRRAKALAEVARAGVPATAQLRLSNGETIRLVWEAGGWHVEGGVLQEGALRTPRDTVAALRRALARRSLPGVLAVLAREPRAELEQEIRHWIEGTAVPEDLSIDMRGSEATVRSPDGPTLRLVREAGEWKVSELGSPP